MSPGADAVGGQPANVGAVIALCEKWEVNRRRSARSPRPAGCVSFDGRARRDMPVRGSSTMPAIHCDGEAGGADLCTAEATLPECLTARGAAALLASRISPRAGLCSSSTTRSCSRDGAPPEQATPVLALRWQRAGGIIDCNAGACRRIRYRGTIEAALECAATLACVGASPLGTTTPNYGNPRRRISLAADRIGGAAWHACRALEAPIVGGTCRLKRGRHGGPIYRRLWWAWSAACPTLGARVAWLRPCGRRVGSLVPFAVARRERAGKACAARRLPTACRSSHLTR